jgi:hypothetical protein
MEPGIETFVVRFLAGASRASSAEAASDGFLDRRSAR